jgi:cobalt-zinc-cadmium efflux system outer membrane protein
MRIPIKASGASIVHAYAVLITCAAISIAPPANPTEARANPRLTAWVEQTLARNPELQAAAAAAAASRARLTGAGRPLYNPEFELEYERSDIDLTTAELLQPLDWHGKREARERVADSRLMAARAEYNALRERLTAELLGALAEYEGSRALMALAARRVALLERFADVAKARSRVGDLGQVEVELAELAYVEGKMAAGSDKAALADALNTLYRITGAVVPKAGLPEVPAEALPRSSPPGELAARHPEVRAARARAQVARVAVRRADTDRRADPTIGIKGGREDEAALFGLRLHIPLQVRNDFRADVKAARSEWTQASYAAAQIERQTVAELNAAQQRYRALLEAWQIWARKGRGSLETRVQLLERLWRVGELSTTDYLVQLKQSLETESAGRTLQRELWQSWLGWLRAAGQVQTWLGLKSKEEKGWE